MANLRFIASSQTFVDAELKVYSNFIVYRSRAETEQDYFVGVRQDVLRRVDGAWKIARRKWCSTRTCCRPRT